MNLFYREPAFFENTIYSKIFDASQKFFVSPNSTPIFIVGNQKSGTTVVARLLSMALGKSIISDIPVRNGVLLQKVIDGKQPLKIFYKNRPHFFSKDIIKEPALTFFIGDLLTLCPNATFVFIVRDPRDNIKSILNRVNIPGNLKRINLNDSKDLNIIWKRILAGNGEFEDCNYIKNLSLRWCAGVQQFITFSRRLILVKYEDFCKNKANYIYSLCEKTGYKPTHSIEDYVDVQFQPKGDSKTGWSTFFENDNLKIIESICANNMKTLGYNLPREQAI